jgi:hypothetical protein
MVGTLAASVHAIAASQARLSTEFYDMQALFQRILEVHHHSYEHKLHVYSKSRRGGAERRAVLADHLSKLLLKDPAAEHRRIRVSDVDDPASGYSATRIEFNHGFMAMTRFFHRCFSEAPPEVAAGFSSRQPESRTTHLYHNPAAAVAFEGTIGDFTGRVRPDLVPSVRPGGPRLRLPPKALLPAKGPERRKQ